MASFVGWCKHDVFVSYAHVDDEVRLGEDRPWISTFVAGLETGLAAKLGRRENLDIWSDRTLGGDRKITPEILEALHGTATLIVILSPGYVESEWCQREKQTFLRLIEERYGSPSDSRVFVVEIDEVGNARPGEFGDLKPYTFWTQTTEGRSRRVHLGREHDRVHYEDNFVALICDLSDRLKSLQVQGGKPKSNGAARVKSATDAAKTVYLAQAAGDLQYVREDVERRLRSENLNVLPNRLYPPDLKGYRARLDQDLKESDYFAQLLDTAPGPKFEGVPDGYAVLQFSRALEVVGAKRMLCWYDALKCPIDQLKDPDQRGFVQGAEAKARLWTAGIEEFKSAIVAECQQPDEAPPSSRGAPLVFVNAHQADNDIVAELRKALTKEQLDFSRPQWEGKPGQIREELTKKIEECDAQIVVFGDITPGWVDQQLSLTRKVRADKQLGKSLAVFVAPPPDPEDKSEKLTYQLADMRFLDARTGISEKDLRDFVTSLKA